MYKYDLQFCTCNLKMQMNDITPSEKHLASCIQCVYFENKHFCQWWDTNGAILLGYLDAYSLFFL